MVTNFCDLAAVFVIWINIQAVFAFTPQYLDCGPYGFICERNNKIRLCEGSNIFGPAFLCPPNTICNEDSTAVCEDIINHIDNTYIKNVRCHGKERIADPNVPDCKGYILCIPNNNRFQGIKFKCSGNTIFNGYTRTCSSPDSYKCPVVNVTKPEIYDNDLRRMDGNRGISKPKGPNAETPRAIECKNYKFSVTQNNPGSGSARATYFCPSRPASGGEPIKCTIFSNKFCITLDRDEHDQFMVDHNVAFRKPRK